MQFLAVRNLANDPLLSMKEKRVQETQGLRRVSYSGRRSYWRTVVDGRIGVTRITTRYTELE